MFGQDDNQQPAADTGTPLVSPSTDGFSASGSNDNGVPVFPGLSHPGDVASGDSDLSAPVADTVNSDQSADFSAPELTAVSSDETSTVPSDDSGASNDPTPASNSDDVAVSAASGDDDLVGLKQQALQQLTPLVGQLDQSPEEKFRTTMMMIQAADDKSLIKDAFEAAQKIEDDKNRAQALLDVINEINYFTQPKND